MTSMLLTDSASRRGAGIGLRCGIEATVVDAVATPTSSLLQSRGVMFFSSAYFAGALLDHLAHQRAVARHERRHGLNFLPSHCWNLTMPEPSWSVQLRLERREQAGRAELLQPRLVEVRGARGPSAPARRVITLPLPNLSCAMRIASTIMMPYDDAARVIDRADARLVLEVALARAVDLLLDVLHHREVGAGRGERGA